jgi:DNA-binding NarL/FixJ family response regulator
MYRILVADPDSATRKALIRLLQHKLGTDCFTEVGDVETLIRALADLPPDLLLLDWRLYGSPSGRAQVSSIRAPPQMN